MKGRDLEDFATGWLAKDLIDEATKNDDQKGSGCGAIFFWGFIGFILFSIYAISGIEFNKIWTFLKIITFPITWDYQLLNIKLFGVNNYYSTVGSIVVAVIIYYLLKMLDKIIIQGIEGRIAKKNFVRFQPIQTVINIISVLYDLFVNISTIYMIVLIGKIMLHGFLSIFTFIFSL